VTAREVWALAIAFGVLGLLSAAHIGTTALVAALIIWLVGQAYNWKGNDAGLAGNMMVSASVGSTFIIGGISVDGTFSGLVWTFAGLAFFFDLGEEILRGIMDVRGDAIRGSRSLIRTRGRDFALKSAGVAFSAFILISFAPYLTGLMGWSYLAIAAVIDLTIIYYKALDDIKSK